MTEPRRATSGSLTAFRILLAALVIATVAQILIEVADADPVILLPGVVLVYGGLIVAWRDGVARLSGPPNVWFTVVVPVLACAQGVGVEAANAAGFEFDTSAVPLGLLPLAVTVTSIGAYRAGRRWKTGLVAWSLLLFHLGIVIGGLAGIPLSTFGEDTRTDEVMLYVATLPLLAMVVAAVLAPRTRLLVKVSIASLIAVAAPAWLVTQTVLVGVAALGVAGLMITVVATRPTLDDVQARRAEPVISR